MDEALNKYLEAIKEDYAKWNTYRSAPEDDIQAGDRDDIAVNKVTQDITGADTRELVGVADEEEVAGGMDGFQDVVHQDQIDHRAFVQDQKVTFQGVVRVALELEDFAGANLQ